MTRNETDLVFEQIALVTDIHFPAAEKAKAYLENPEAFAAVAVAAPVAAAAVEKKEEKVEEKEESDDDMGFGLFDCRFLSYPVQENCCQFGILELIFEFRNG